MPIMLVLSYAFSIWMVVDAFNRGSQGWWIVIIFLPFGEIVYFFVVKIHDFRLPVSSNSESYVTKKLWDPKPKFICKTCLYCDSMDHDGVQCRQSGTAIFKTPINISYCGYYTR